MQIEQKIGLVFHPNWTIIAGVVEIAFANVNGYHTKKVIEYIFFTQTRESDICARTQKHKRVGQSLVHIWMEGARMKIIPRLITPEIPNKLRISRSPPAHTYPVAPHNFNSGLLRATALINDLCIERQTSGDKRQMKCVRVVPVNRFAHANSCVTHESDQTNALCVHCAAIAGCPIASPRWQHLWNNSFVWAHTRVLHNMHFLCALLHTWLFWGAARKKHETSQRAHNNYRINAS